MIREPENFPRSPVIEAVIESRFDSSFSPRDIQRLRDRLIKDYPTAEDLDEIELVVGDTASQKKNRVGFQLTAKSAIDRVVFNSSQKSLGTVRAAPYDCWDSLFEKAQQNNEALISVIGRSAITRLGVRFINRIDVPSTDAASDHRLYFNVWPTVPAGLSPLPNFYGNVQARHDVSGARVLLQFGTAVAPLIDFSSFLLDIDVSFESDIPRKMEDIWQLLATLRSAKNDVFHASITDQTRALFR